MTAGPLRWFDPQGRPAPSGSAWVGCHSAETEPLLGAALPRPGAGVGGNALVLLVAPRPAPPVTARNDGPVGSFLAAGPWLSRLFARPASSAEQLCYRALALALSGEIGAMHLDVVHDAAPPAAAAVEAAVDVIIPHRGSDAHLRTCIEALMLQSHPCRIRVGLDQAMDPQAIARLPAGDRLSYVAISPTPAGPYVLRQHLCLGSDADFLAFQDSDDVPVPARIARLLGHARTSGVDMVGSHELRLDEIGEVVEAIRFPLDVNAALDIATGHAQFFPTTLVRAPFLRATGGFSTSRRFGADYQFLLRSSLIGRIANVDAFLYIRRRRAGSLTTARATSLRSPARRLLTWRWKRAFAMVREGRLAMKDSSLQVSQTRRNHIVTDIDSGETESARLRINRP